MGNYATTTQVKTFKIDGCLVDVESYSDTEIETSIALAESMIENITGDCFYVKTVTNTFDGNGLTFLAFPPRISYRLLSITSARDIDIDGTVLETFVEGDDFVKYPHYLETALAFAEDTPRRGIFRGGVWPRGQANISIAGTWGRSTTPPEITRATILLTLEDLNPGSTQMAANDVKQVVWSDFTMTLTANEDRYETTGFPKVDKLLQGHINYAGLFFAIPDSKQTYDRKTKRFLL
jgi:hypothetical protein